MQSGPRPLDERDPPRRRPRRLAGCLLVWPVAILLIVIGVALAFGITALGISLIVGVGWVTYEGLLLPAVSIQETLVGFSWAPRLLMFGVWLSLTVVVSVVLVNTLARRIRSDSVVGVLVASTLCVLLALAGTSWAVYFLIRVLPVR